MGGPKKIKVVQEMRRFRDEAKRCRAEQRTASNGRRAGGKDVS